MGVKPSVVNGAGRGKHVNSADIFRVKISAAKQEQSGNTKKDKLIRE